MARLLLLGRFLSLPELLRRRLPCGVRLAFWAQAEVVTMATDCSP